MPLELWDDIEEEFDLYGIRSNGISEVRFIFNFNKLYDFNFARLDDLDIYLDKELFCFSLYSHQSYEDKQPIYLIKNHSHVQKNENPEGSLFATYQSYKYILNKYKIFDYLLKLPIDANEITSKLLPLTRNSCIQKINPITNSLSKKEKKLLVI